MIGGEMRRGPETAVRKWLSTPISRRRFLARGAATIAALGVGGYFVFRSAPANDTTIFRGDAPATLDQFSLEAMHYTQLASKRTQCFVCPHLCVLEPEDRSMCRVKVNKDGKLYTTAYGNPCSVHVDPIEKKPLFHFLPQSQVFSVATAGCNFRCLNCQNWTISQRTPQEVDTFDLKPDRLVSSAQQQGCASIAYTYSEPIAFYEYMYNSSKAARQAGLRNVWVTNGYINYDALEDLSNYLDAANVDLKAFDDATYAKLTAGSLSPVLDTLRTLDDKGVWFEVTTLMVPTYTDDVEMVREMARWMVKKIGPDYPLHLSRFQPEYKLTHLPSTPVSLLTDSRKAAMEEGLHYVYIGNVPGIGDAENTYCPGCGSLVVERKGYLVLQNRLEGSRCPDCDTLIAGVWEA